MKTKLARVLGIVITLMLVTSFIVGIPSTASAGTQAWSKVTMPAASTATAGNQLSATNKTSVVTARDGTIYAATATDAAAPVPALLSSTNGGKSWAVIGGTAMNTALAGAGVQIIAIVPSKQTPSRIYVAISDGVGVNQVWVSTNSGVSFATTYDLPAGTGNIMAMDVTYQPSKSAHLIAVGTDAAATTNNVLMLDESVAFPTWVVNGDPTMGRVNAVAFSPNFATDGMVQVVGDNTIDMIVKQRIGAGGWATIQTFLTPASGLTAVVAPSPVPGAVIGFPSDFDVTASNVTFVGLNQTATDDLYEIIKGAAGPVALHATGSAPFPGVASLAINGTSSGATILVGLDTTAAPASATVRRSANGGISWASASKQPTGGDAITGSLAFVAMPSDFATSNVAYVGTAALPLASATIDRQGEFAVSGDGGVTFNGRSLIDTNIASINQVLPAGNDLFVVTTSVAGVSSLWRTSAATAGADWYRILTAQDAGGSTPAMVVGASSAFATDATLWVAKNDTVTPAINTAKSVNADSGAVFTASFSSITLASSGVATDGKANAISVLSPTSVLVADGAGKVERSINNGIVWAGVATGAASVQSMAVSGTNVLVGGNAGNTFLSTNSGATFRAMATTGTPAADVTVAFDPGYATNNLVYLTDGGVGGTGTIDRITVGTSAATDVAETIGAVTTGSTGIAALAGPASMPATLYVADAAADTAPARSINPNGSLASPATAPVFELTGSNTPGAALPGATATLGGLVAMQSASGPNTLWAIDTTNLAVLTYTDTLNVVASAGTAVATSPTSASVSWPAVANATGYAVNCTTPLGAIAPLVTMAAAGAPNAVITGMTTGAAYTFTVNVATPDLSYVSASAPLTTQPGAAPWNPSVGAVVVAPAAGGTGISTTPTLQWNTTTGATGFELLVSSSSAVTGARLTTGDVVDKTGANALVGNGATVYTVTPALSYSTTYYWQVRAVLGSGFSPWTAVFAFTTAAAPVTTTSVPPVTVTNTTVTQPPATQTTIIVTQPPQTTTIVTSTVVPPPTIVAPTTTQPTPAWVWAIIAIGGILLIVVIVLIARTRKV